MNKTRMQERYEKESVEALQKQFGFANPMQLPKLEKIVVSMGIKDGVSDNKVVEKAAEELMLITGQKPVITKAKKSIAGFKLREGVAIGCKVTLRRHMMWEFLDRLVNIALPRVKDFRGMSSKQFDGKGNYSYGLKEQIVFPEINYDKIDKIRGMNIAFITSTNSDEEAKALLETFNFPFKK